MDIRIIAVGKIKDQALSTKIEDYSKRLSHDCRLDIVEIKDSDKETEGKKILQSIERDRGVVVALSEEGREFTSKQFADYMDKASTKITFIIGGPFGLSDSVKSEVRLILALSKMTFTHEMARMFLLEQIYRGMSINHNRKYHKD